LIRLRSKSVVIFANYKCDYYFLQVNNQNPACLLISSTRCQNQSAPIKVWQKYKIYVIKFQNAIIKSQINHKIQFKNLKQYKKSVSLKLLCLFKNWNIIIWNLFELWV